MPSSLVTILLALIRNVHGAPVSGLLEPSHDNWASSLADVGPLILLIGERTTKQHLREAHGPMSAFSLAAGPLGLVTVVVSLVRFQGSHSLRSFLGCEMESRSQVAIEVSRLNANGIHSELVDGYIVRSTVARSEARAGAVGAIALRGNLDQDGPATIAQLKACHQFESTKASLNVPSDAGRLQWCLHAVVESRSEAQTDQLTQLLSTALQLESCGGGKPAADDLRLILRRAGRVPYNPPVSLEADVNMLAKSQPSANGCRPSPPNSKTITISSDQHPPMPEKFEVKGTCDGALSFLATCDAVSEFSAVGPISRVTSLFIGMSALSAIALLLVLVLKYDLGWELTGGWLLAALGYVGIVTLVVSASLIMQNATSSIRFRPQDRLSPSWRTGVFIAEQTDEKTGADLFLPRSGAHLEFEAAWLRPTSRKSRLVADSVAAGLVISFLGHYLGLRSSAWWLAASELGICILAAIARSVVKKQPAYFFKNDDGSFPTVDWRCASTGLITCSAPKKLNSPGTTNVDRLDLRIYSCLNNLAPPTEAERIAWWLASACLDNTNLVDRLLRALKISLLLLPTEKSPDHRALVVAFGNGVLTKEGLASPNTTIAVAFTACTTSLSRPTGLLARGIMRQPEWVINGAMLSNINAVLNNVHIPALESLVTWWTVAESRNGPRDLQENLQWAFLLLNCAFFILLRRDYAGDAGLMSTLERAHSNDGEYAKAQGQKLCHFITDELCKTEI